MRKENKRVDDLEYYVYSPEQCSKNLPVILFLHGIGERGTELSNIEAYALPKYMNIFDIPFMVIAPQCHNDNFWDYHLREVEKIIDQEEENYNFDKDNIFLCGYSMGAFGAWNYLIERPELFKGIVSVSGGIMLPIDITLNPIKDKSILMYHGEKDDIVDVNYSINAYNKLVALEAKDIRLQILKNANHFLSDEVFSDPNLYEWLEERSLKGKARTRTK